MYRDPDQRDFARRLRNQMTEAEKSLWHFLRAQRLDGHKFRRQAAIGAYVVDFVCFAENLIVELDGAQHGEPDAAEYDAQRTAWLLARGYRVMRFWNHKLDEEIQSVVEQIRRALAGEELNAPQSPLPNPPRQGEGPEGTNVGDEGREAPSQSSPAPRPFHPFAFSCVFCASSRPLPAFSHPRHPRNPRFLPAKNFA
jgi:very-short-patch-repair endonuclease